MRLLGWLIVGLGVVASSDGAESDRVTMDYDMAEAGIEWLELAASGSNAQALRTHFMENVAPTGGCQSIVRHWARFREWDEAIFYDFILEALGKKETDKPLVNENGDPTGLGRARELWTAALADPSALRRDLQALRDADLCPTALGLAKKYLPDDADVTNAFHIVLFGASSAFSVGEENGFDLLQLAKQPDGAVDVDRVMRTFAHEMHHSGFANGAEKHMKAIEDEDRIQLVGILAAEGMATWFTTPPFDHLDEYRMSSVALDRELASDWNRHLESLPELYRNAERDIRRSLEGDMTLDELMGSWLEGAAGAGYVVGADMFRTIEVELGVEAAKPVAQDYRLLLAVYNRAARQAIVAGTSSFVFDDDLVEKVRLFTDSARR